MRYILAVVILFFEAFVIDAAQETDAIPGFFLKISKNIPRIGRREDPSFGTISKSVSRLEQDVSSSRNSLRNFLQWLKEEPMVKLQKRRLGRPKSTYAADEHEYSVIQPVNTNTLIALLEKDAIPPEHVKFVHWKDFDFALQFDSELYNKIMSLGRAPDKRLKEDLNLRSATVNPWFKDRLGANDDELLGKNYADDVHLNSQKFSRDFFDYNHI